MRRVVFLLSSAAALLGLLAHEVLACPPMRSSTADWSVGELIFPLLLLLGVPALVFRTLAPPPLSFAESRKLWPLRAWSAALSAFLLLTLSFRHWRQYVGKVADTVRQRVVFEGRTSAFKGLAKDVPWSFTRAWVLSGITAALGTIGMWAWTMTDPDVSWGQGWQIPVLFTVDTLLTFFTVRWLTLRVCLHTAHSLVGPPSWSRGVVMAVRAGVLGGAAGWLWGALFGLSSGIQTYLCVAYTRVDVVPLLTGWYGIHTLLLGGVVGLGLAVVMAWPVGTSRKALTP